MRRALAAVVVTMTLASCSEVGGDDPSSGRMTCNDLAAEAVAISDDQGVQLLKVRNPEAELDKQETGWNEPTGADEVVILRCLGAGVWSNDTSANVRLELSIDADGDAFVSYKVTR